MSINYCVLLTSFSLVFLSRVGFSFEEKRFTQRPPKEMHEKLYAKGDYSKLKFFIRTEKEKYHHGEFIDIEYGIYNNSPDDVHIFTGRLPYYGVNIVEIKDANNLPVPMTRYGNRILEMDRKRYRTAFAMHSGYNYIKLHPKEEYILSKGYGKRINTEFDLTEPGKYEITYYRRAFISGQEYDPPLKSNTLTITILKAPFLTGRPLLDGDTFVECFNPPREELDAWLRAKAEEESEKQEATPPAEPESKPDTPQE